MKTPPLALLSLALALVSPPVSLEAGTVVVGWNDLGMHCMDGSDFSVFSILPPYNTVNAHILHNGVLVTDTNAYTLTYKAVADPTGSINRTTADKVNFWDYEDQLFGVSLDPDQGLTGLRMPGAVNTPQGMHLVSVFKWFAAEGVPISPFDDAGRKNYYPMFRLEAWDASSNRLASTDVVLPVSDEMHCSACHQSGGDAAAKPVGGWVWACDQDHDFKLNVLRLHDERRGGSPQYATALSQAGHHPSGLYASVRVNAKPAICAQCHRSNALPGMGQTNISYFTSAIHARHANVVDPDTGLTLESDVNRDSCYRCHPGSSTRCLRGAMGKAVAADGTLAMSCQSCHGSMSDVGSASRDGWFDEPNCQSCHTGNATNNSGQIRFTSVFASPGTPRVAAEQTFATSADTPLPGKSLYRFSAGHAGLQCAACHGSPHAIYPSSHRNDNVQNQQLQGHAGTLAECSACHGGHPRTFLDGPHGMHPVADSDFAVKRDGQEQWHHKEAKEDGGVGVAACRACHGVDYRGTELSRAHANRELDTDDFGTKFFWRGQTIGCFTCHNGPLSEAPSANVPPVASNVTVVATANSATNVVLRGGDANGDGLTWRIVSQPLKGSVALSGTSATYIPFTNRVGADVFTFAARDGFDDSNLATGAVSVVPGAPTVTCDVVAPTSVPVHVAAPFRARAALHGATGDLSFAWTFGDGTGAGNVDEACHRYCRPGSYAWTSVVSAAGVRLTKSGTILVEDGVVDEDADGIGDYWELAWFRRLGAADARSDADHDGFLDSREWPAGTIPTNPLSLLAITNVLPTAGGGVRIVWMSVSNRQYEVARWTNLVGSTAETVASNLPAGPPVNVYTDTPPSSPTFYSVGTSRGNACPALP